MDLNSVETEQADLNQLIEANSITATDENTALFKTFVIDKNALKDLNSIIESILRGETPEAEALSATEEIPEIQIKPCSGQATAAEITPMVSSIQNVKTCYEHQTAEYCEGWTCEESNTIQLGENKVTVEYSVYDVVHGITHDSNYLTALTVCIPELSYCFGAVYRDTKQWERATPYICFAAAVSPIDELGRWDMEIYFHDFVDSTEATATTYIDVVECPNKCEADLWQYNGSLNYETKVCQYETVDCDSLNTSGEWEYYCSGRERRKRRMTSDYDCAASGCYLGSQYHSDDQLVENCLFACQTDRCVNGCSGTLTIKAEDLWGQPVSNATVKVNGIAEGTTNASGTLQIPTFSNSCGQIYSIEVITEQGTSCGTKPTIISYFNKDSTVMFNCYQQQSGINSLYLTISTDKKDYYPEEDVLFTLYVNDFLYRPIGGIEIDIKNPDESTDFAQTDSTGNARYLTKAGSGESQRFLFAINEPGWNGTRQEYTIYRKYHNPELMDSDNDGWSDADERLLGSDPSDAHSNMETLIIEHQFRSSCFNPLSWILSDTTEEQSQQIAESLQQMDSQELESLVTTENKSRLLSISALEGIGLAEEDIEQEMISLETLFEESDEMHLFSKGNNVYFVFYDRETRTTTVSAALSHCAGLIIGTAHGMGAGLRDDMGFAYQVLHGIYFYLENIDKILPALSATWDFLTQLPGMIMGGGIDIGGALKEVSFTILKQAEQNNQADPRTERLEYAAFQIGYLEGYTLGYVAEQLFLVNIELDKIVDGFKGIKQTSRAFDWATDALARIAGKFGPETRAALSRLRHLGLVDNILSKGTQTAQNGLARISNALGNKTDDVQTFFKGITQQGAEEITERTERLYLRLSDDIASISDNLLLRKSRAWKTILANYSDDVQEAVLKAVKKEAINDSDEMLQGMTKYSNGSKQAFGIADPTDISNFSPEMQKYQLKYLYKSPKTAAEIGDETISGVASLQKGVKESWGYDHIFEYIRPGDPTTRAKQIQEAFELANDNEAVLDLIREALEQGTKDPLHSNVINYSKSTNQKMLKVVTGTASDKVGTIITISFGG